jgi:hypothetical protein
LNRVEVERCLLDWEIVASILYCSTNYTCNPKADIISHMSPSDPYYTSLPASMKSVPIKQEPMSQDLADTIPANTLPADERDTVPADERDTVPANTLPADERDTVPANTLPADERDTVPANTLPADERDTVPVNTLPADECDTVPANTILTRPDEDDNMDRKIEHEQPSCAFVASLHPEECVRNSPTFLSQHHTNHNDVESTVKSESIEDQEQGSLMAEFDFENESMDVDGFFDDIFKQQKEQARRFQQEQQEQEERMQHQQEKEEQNYRLQLQLQEQEERKRIFAAQKEHEANAHRLGKERQYQQRLAEEQRRVQEEYDKEMERRRRDLQQEESEAEGENDDNNPNNQQEANGSVTMDVTIQQIGQFTKVQYAPLVTKPRPLSQLQSGSSSSNGVNYKRFKKVISNHYMFATI